MPIKLNGATSGATTLTAPAVAGNNTLTMPTGNGSAGQLLQTDGSGNLSWVNGSTVGPAFSAYATAGTSTATATFTKVALGATEFDTANCFSTVNSRFTPTVAGYYFINGGIFAGLSSQVATIYKNGAEAKRGNQALGATLNGGTVSGLIYMNGSTDYVELYWYQQSGSTQNNTTGSPYTYFQGYFVRP